MGSDGIQARDKPVRGFIAPVAGNESPHYRAHALLKDQLAEPGTAKTKGRPEPARLRPSGLSNGFATTEQLAASFRGAAKEQIGMGVRVIADEVAAVGNFANQAGGFPDVFADDKERGFGAITIKQVEKLWCDGGVGTIVEGDGKLFRFVGVPHGVAEELRTRAYRAEGGESRDAGDEGGRGNEPRIHAGYSAMRRGRARQKRKDLASGGYSAGGVWLVKAVAAVAPQRLPGEVDGIDGGRRGDAFDGKAARNILRVACR